MKSAAFRFLLLPLLCVLAANSAFAQDSGCPQDKAIGVMQSDGAASMLCATTGGADGCQYRITPPGLWNLQEKSDPNLLWIITAESGASSVTAKISKSCKIMAQNSDDCPEEKAIRTAESDPAITTLCGRTIGDTNSQCSFKAAQIASEEAKAPGWVVTVTNRWGTTTDRISKTCQIMEDVASCTKEKAIAAAEANPAVTSFCSQTIYGPLFHCEYRAGKSAIYPLGERSDPGDGWLVNASTYKMSAFTKVSPGCRVIQHPIFANTFQTGTVELGVADSADIVIGKVIDVQGPDAELQNGGAKIQSETVTVAVGTVIKGKQVPQVTFDRSFSWPKTSAKNLWLNDGRDRLFFVSRGMLGGGHKTEPGPVLLGSWPNGIDLETAKDGIYPVFSKNGDVLVSRKAILDAVSSELAREADKPAKANIKDFEAQKDLPSDKYLQAYAAGVPAGNVVVLNVPKE